MNFIDNVIEITASTLIVFMILTLIGVVSYIYYKKKLTKSENGDDLPSMEDYFQGLFSESVKQITENIETKLLIFEEKIASLELLTNLFNEEKISELISSNAYGAFMFMLEIPEDKMESFNFRQYLADIFIEIMGAQLSGNSETNENSSVPTDVQQKFNELSVKAIESEIPGWAQLGLNKIWPNWQEEIQKNPKIGIDLLQMAQQYGLLNIFNGNNNRSSHSMTPRISSNQGW